MISEMTEIGRRRESFLRFFQDTRKIPISSRGRGRGRGRGREREREREREKSRNLFKANELLRLRRNGRRVTVTRIGTPVAKEVAEMTEGESKVFNVPN